MQRIGVDQGTQPKTGGQGRRKAPDSLFDVLGGDRGERSEAATLDADVVPLATVGDDAGPDALQVLVELRASDRRTDASRALPGAILA